MSTGAATLTAVRDVFAYYEYPHADKASRAKRLPAPRIYDPEDPRWDDLLMKTPYNGDPHGYLNVAWETRVGGEVLKSEGVHGGNVHKNKAQEFMREFYRLKAEGALKPWDVDHTNRDILAAAEKAKNEGRDKDIQMLAELFARSMKGGPLAADAAVPPPVGSVPQVAAVSRGSPVREFTGEGVK